MFNGGSVFPYGKFEYLYQFFIWNLETALDYFIFHVCYIWEGRITITEAYLDGQAQDCSNSSANALELLQSCAKPSI